MLQLFERIKRFQLEKYHREENAAEKAKIEVDPLKVFHAAVNNCKPLLQLNSVKRGGQRYQVRGIATQLSLQGDLNSLKVRTVLDKKGRLYHVTGKLALQSNQGLKY